jgi:hypothetical protein
MVQCRHAFFVGAQRVADLYPHAMVGQVAHQFQVAGNLGRHGNYAHRRQLFETVHFLDGGGTRIVRLRAQLAAVDIRAFQVGAQHARLALAALAHGLADGGQRQVDVFRRRRHGGGQQRGGAVAGVDSGDGMHGIAAFHHILAGAAVHMQVDEAGQDIVVAVQLRVGAAAGDVHDALAEGNRSVQPAGRCQDIALDCLVHRRDSATNS